MAPSSATASSLCSIIYHFASILCFILCHLASSIFSIIYRLASILCSILNRSASILGAISSHILLSSSRWAYNILSQCYKQKQTYVLINER